MLKAGGSLKEKAWEYIFKSWHYSLHAKILQKGGTSDEVIHALGNICTTWERRVCRADFDLKSASLRHYLSVSVYYNWLKLKKQETVILEELSEDLPELLRLDDPLTQDDTRLYVRKILNEIVGIKCQRVLCWYAGGYSMAEIGKMMGIRSESAKNLKFKCLKKLNEKYEEHPEWFDALRNLFYG